MALVTANNAWFVTIAPDLLGIDDNSTATKLEDLPYCERPVLPTDRPSNKEILVPPLFLSTILIIGLTALFLSAKRKNKNPNRWKGYLEKKNSSSNIKCDLGDLVGGPRFLNDFDLEVLDEMKVYCNKPRELVKICVPAFVCLLLTSCFMFAHDYMFSCIWPNRERPDINTGVTCFLAPAGLVYALSFGFTFQQALEKHRAIMEKVTNELSLMDQLITMTGKLNLPTKRHNMAMLKAIKSELIFMAMLVQNREPSTFKQVAPPNVKVHIWSILDVLRHAAGHPEYQFNMNVILVDKMVNYLLELNSICTDRMGALHTRIHPLKWLFLEILGNISLFGVMLVDASSRLMEITMCELTVFSITMLFYVLADLDSPFNGFFRVDLTLIPEVVRRAEVEHQKALSASQLEDLKNKIEAAGAFQNPSFKTQTSVV